VVIKGHPQGGAGRIAARLARHLEVALAQLDLSPSQYRILMFLDEGSVPASALAERSAITPPSVTTVVDGLVARGLVARRHDEGDRRRVGHAITPKGRRLLAEADAAVAARLAELATCLADEGQVAAAFDSLEIWREALDAFRAKRRAQPQAEAR